MGDKSNGLQDWISCGRCRFVSSLRAIQASFLSNYRNNLLLEFIQAKEEKKGMDSLQRSNKHILFNLLPSHVAMHFLDNQLKSNMVSISKF